MLWVAAVVLAFALSNSGGAAQAQAKSDGASLRHYTYLVLVFFSPLIAGVSGSSIRRLRPTAGEAQHSLLQGATAGAIAGLLYLAGQLDGSAASIGPHVVLLSVALGFVAGLTFDVFFEKVAAIRALREEGLGKE